MRCKPLKCTADEPPNAGGESGASLYLRCVPAFSCPFSRGREGKRTRTRISRRKSRNKGMRTSRRGIPLRAQKSPVGPQFSGWTNWGLLTAMLVQAARRESRDRPKSRSTWMNIVGMAPTRIRSMDWTWEAAPSRAPWVPRAAVVQSTIGIRHSEIQKCWVLSAEFLVLRTLSLCPFVPLSLRRVMRESSPRCGLSIGNRPRGIGISAALQHLGRFYP